MTFKQFEESLLNREEAPSELSEVLKALWIDAKGDWDAAHSIVQQYEDTDNMWVHAYLHRKEGVLWNADYWYSRAGKKRPDVSLEEEWEQIVRELLSR